MIVFEGEIVIHKDFGGFSFDREIADWLEKNKKWKIGGLNDYEKQEYKILKAGENYYLAPDCYEENIRFDKDLIKI
jgi:hypothetical protein